MKKDTNSNLSEAMAVFGTPATIAPAPKKGKAKKAEREEHDFGQDLDYLAALSTVAKALEQTAKVIAAEQRDAAYKLMAQKMIDEHRKPDTVIGRGPRAEAYVTLKKNASNRALDEQTVERLSEMNIPVDRNVTMPGRLVLNPEILENQELLRAVAESIQNNPKLKGVPVILQQEEVANYAVGEDTLPALARVIPDDIDDATDLLSRVATIQISRFKIDGEKDPSRLIEKSLEIITEARLLVIGPGGPGGKSEVA